MACQYRIFITQTDIRFCFRVLIPFFIEPKRWKNCNVRGLMIAIRYINFYENIVGIMFGVSNEYIKIFIVIEYTRIQNFEFRFMLRPNAVFLNELLIRECLLWIFI